MPMEAGKGTDVLRTAGLIIRPSALAHRRPPAWCSTWRKDKPAEGRSHAPEPRNKTQRHRSANDEERRKHPARKIGGEVEIF